MIISQELLIEAMDSVVAHKNLIHEALDFIDGNYDDEEKEQDIAHLMIRLKTQDELYHKLARVLNP